MSQGVEMHTFLVLTATLLLVLSGCATTPPPHSSRDSLDWSGMYVGTLPCADCEGIQTSMTINQNQSFVLVSTYLGKDNATFESQGVFSWSDDGSTIILPVSPDSPSRYRVGENTLTMLDLDGQVITGDLAAHYVLHKQLAPPPDLSGQCVLGVRWKLVELLGQPVPPNASGKSPFILLSAEGNRITGFGGCNAISGAFVLKVGNRLRFSDMASTLMACPDMETEQRFFEILAQTDNFACNGQTLFLHKARMAPLARFEAAPGN